MSSSIFFFSNPAIKDFPSVSPKILLAMKISPASITSSSNACELSDWPPSSKIESIPNVPIFSRISLKLNFVPFKNTNLTLLFSEKSNCFSEFLFFSDVTIIVFSSIFSLIILWIFSVFKCGSIIILYGFTSF